MTKKTAPKLPAPAIINHVLRKAYNAPHANCDEANYTQQCIREITEFLSQLQAAGSSKPQASASSGGSSSDQL
jgi:hypothetical protein